MGNRIRGASVAVLIVGSLGVGALAAAPLTVIPPIGSTLGVVYNQALMATDAEVRLAPRIAVRGKGRFLLSGCSTGKASYAHSAKKNSAILSLE